MSTQVSRRRFLATAAVAAASGALPLAAARSGYAGTPTVEFSGGGGDPYRPLPTSFCVETAFPRAIVTVTFGGITQTRVADDQGVARFDLSGLRPGDTGTITARSPRA